MVLIFWQPDAPQETCEEILADYQTLAEECGGREAGIRFFHVSPNIDNRKGEGLVELAVYDDAESFQAFRTHPAHVAIANKLSQVAD